MPSLDENAILALGTDPIPGGSPCGTDAAEDAMYIAVTAEMPKMDRIDADEPDWFVVEQNCTQILRSKSKDVEVASWLGHALFKQYSYAGLSASFALFTAMVKNFWDDSFPTRPRRRKARIEALANRFVEHGWFRDNQPKPNDFDALDLCVTRTEEFIAALTEKMPDEPPDLGKFMRGLKEQAGKRPKPAAAPAPPAEGGAAPAAAAAPAGGQAFGGGEVSDKGSAVKAVMAACTFLRKADLTDPVPYAIVRAVKWSTMSLPTSEEAKTQIPPPDASVVDALNHQMGNSLWEHLLKGAEGAFRSNDPLWLDLQRYLCSAMKGLGAPYDQAYEAVVSATAGLVRRLGDGVFELRFRDGTPLTSGETKMWIEGEVVGADGGGGGGGSSAADGNGRLLEASNKARKLAGSGKLKEALTELQEGLHSCTQRRDRFLWRLRIAQLCYEAQRLRLAAPLLEECHNEIQRYHIDEWEPTLAIDVAQTLYRCRKSLTLSEKTPAQEALNGVRDSFAWLCQLDPVAALAAEPSGK